MTDISMGWTGNRSAKYQGENWEFEALEQIMAVFPSPSPFPVLGIDSDNGYEFINEHRLAYCIEHGIASTRSRSGNKNDGAHVEQKNWFRARELVGYLRYGIPPELELLNEI